MGVRADRKKASRGRILEVATRAMRRDGVGGAPIATVMAGAELTHGAFYSHFANKDDLLVEAFKHAMVESRVRWLAVSPREAWAVRLPRLAKRYLSRKHRDDAETSCPLAALVSDMPRGSSALRLAYEAELRQTIADVIGQDGMTPLPDELSDQAIALIALCAGGLSLSRAVEDEAFSDQILAACKRAAERLAQDDAKSEVSPASRGGRAQ